jgi:DNA repair protein RadA/Sms
LCGHFRSIDKVNEMPKLAEINSHRCQFIDVPSLPWLNHALNGGFVRGAVYLLAGGPGLGKTTLVNQALGDIANRGRKVLYISTEQTLGHFKTTLERLHKRRRVFPSAILENFYADDTVDDLGVLPRFLTRKVLTAGEQYSGVEVIVIDSIQGHGLSSNATRKYAALYEFMNAARAQGLVTILVGHVTKGGTIAGPKNLEHNVDCILSLRRAFRLRPLFVQKNRFGPATPDPILLMMDEQGCLIRSPLSAAKRTAVYGFSGTGDELTETQASICLPKPDCRPELLAPFLPEKRVRQLLGILNALPEVDLTDLTYHIDCYLPRQQRYRQELDLPLSIALLGSYLQQAIPDKAVFAGEIDLATRVRSPDVSYLRNLASVLLGSQADKIRRVFVARGAVTRLSGFRVDKSGPCLGDAVQVVGVSDLKELIVELWPDLVANSSAIESARLRS